MSNTKIVIDKERFDIEVNHLKEEYNKFLEKLQKKAGSYQV